MKFTISSVSDRKSYPPPASVSQLKDIHGNLLWEVEISTLEELIEYIRACGDNVVIRLAVKDLPLASLTVYDHDPAYYHDRRRK